MIETLIVMLQDAQKPVILMGNGARETALDIIDFAERFDIPILTTWHAIDLIEWEHPNFIGRMGVVATRGANLAIQECDLLLSIGARLDVQTVAFEYEQFAPKAKKVMVDVDKNEGAKIPNLDLFIYSDAKRFMMDLCSKISLIPPKRSDWLKQCQEWKAKYGPEGGNTITYQLCEQLGRLLTSEDVFVISTAGLTGGTIFPAFFKNPKGLRVVNSSSGLGSMGGGIPAAIGVALASNKHVVCIDGDGSFMQNIQELEVVHRLNLDITFFVVCNGGYASIHSSEERAFGRYAGADKDSGFTLPDIAKVATAFGLSTSQYDPDYMERIMRRHSPQIVTVVSSGEYAAPRVMFDGRGSLSDMWPYEDTK